MRPSDRSPLHLAPRPQRAPRPSRVPLVATLLALLGLAIAAASVDVRAAPRPDCEACGRVTAVEIREQPGEATGVGAVVGGAIGGLVGRELARRHDHAPLVILGAIGGGVLGHHIEKRARTVSIYDVDVRMDDGTVRRLSQREPVRIGDRVQLDGDRAVPLDRDAAPARPALPAPDTPAPGPHHRV